MSRHLFGLRQGKLVRAAAAVAVAALGGAAMSGCTAKQQEGQSPAYLIVSSFNAAAGATPDQLSGTLASDVLTFVKVEGEGGGENGEDSAPTFAPTIFSDNGEANFVLALKDPGSIDNPTTPSTMNLITINRYHVDYRRADGRNVQGQDVPYSFDGAFTLTIGPSGAKASFTLVRAQAKEEAPLRALRGSGASSMISTIAEVTFYGFDQAGREVSVKGFINVNFGDWGDPK